MCYLTSPAFSLTNEVKLGVEILATQHPEMVRGKKIALLVSKTSVDENLNSVIDRLAKAAEVKLIFTADESFREIIPGINAQDKRDALTNAKIIIIDDPLMRPLPGIFQDIDLLVIDIQDIGIRYYKYITIIAQFLDVAKEAGMPVLILDRPNPINASIVAGPVLEVELRSKFGVYPIPLIYGMTIGELALYFNKVFGLGADLTVMGMEGYKRSMSFSDTKLHWFPPINHLPEADSPDYYAITGFLGEMGVFSTGIGTTRPFHYILAPWIDGELLANKLEKHQLPGIRFVPISIKPYYGLYSRRLIYGIEIVITDKLIYDPFLSGVAILRALWELYPDKIPLNNPTVAEAIDTLLGSSVVRTSLLNSASLMSLYTTLQPNLTKFLKKRKEFLIYPE